MQKFKRGDVVHIAADLGQSMSHFTKDVDVVILGSYADQFGGGNVKDYTVLFCSNGNEVAWYEEHQLTFLYYGGEKLISKIKKEREGRQEVEGDLNWIVDNWRVIKTRGRGYPSASMDKLMSLIGITEPWGRHGEGIDRWTHIQYTLTHLDPILMTGNIEKVKQFIDGFPKVNEFIVSSDLHNGHNEFRKP